MKAFNCGISPAAGFADIYVLGVVVTVNLAQKEAQARQATAEVS